jgi:hypothetical protein
MSSSMPFSQAHEARAVPSALMVGQRAATSFARPRSRIDQNPASHTPMAAAETGVVVRIEAMRAL